MTAPIRRFDVQVSVTLRSPFIMAGVVASGIGIDTPALRDEQGRPVLPGDHLKGLVLEGMKALKDADEPLLEGLKIERLFGTKSAYEHDDQTKVVDSRAPDRGSLRFRDLVALDCKDAFEITRIAINEKTGAAKTGALQVVELVAGLGKRVPFTGSLLFYGTDAEAAVLQRVLEKALKLILFFGGLRSAGFGEHVWKEARVVSVNAINDKPTGWPPLAKRADITATFDRPFLAAVERAAENVYLGGSYLPGAAIKGALADMMTMLGRGHELSGKLGDMLSKLSISHAVPVAGDGKELDQPIPLSIMRAAQKNGSLFRDALGKPDPGLMTCDDGVQRCADFQPEWKHEHERDARNASGRIVSELAPLPRGHTSIAQTTGTAVDSELFVEVARSHLADARAGMHQTFRFTVDASACDHGLPETSELLRMLTTGLDAVGKTHARFEVVGAKSIAPPEITGQGPWRILLETEAPLLDPDGSDNQYATVTKCLDAYFEFVFGGAVKRVDHFCQRRIAGGYALLRRKLGNHYAAQTVFKAGSCFLIEAVPGREKDAIRKLEELAAYGMPVVTADASGKLTEVTDWRRTAYLPSHGYGRISIDDPVFSITRLQAGGAT